VIFALACGFILALDSSGEGFAGSPEQIVNSPNWVGTWTSNNRYGGQTYMCSYKNRIYGSYSNAGFFIGEETDRTMEGLWFEGGRGYRNDWQGSFKITIDNDNQEFTGFWYRVSQAGNPNNNWSESRLGAPYPSFPSPEQCLMPVHQYLTGQFYEYPGEGRAPVVYNICRDKWDQIYGSFGSPDGYLEGWSVDSGSGFQGYRYDSNGNSGAFILRSITENEVRGFYWRGRLASQNIETSQQVVLTRMSYITDLKACERVGPGFQQRLRGPGNNAGILTFSFTLIVALFFVLF